MRVEVFLLASVIVGGRPDSVRPGQVASEWRASVADTVELVEEFSLGGVEADDVPFGSIASVHVTTHGEIWVADRLAREIYRFSSSGRFLGPVGRAGEGPGEIGRVVALAARPDGVVAAWDPVNGRVHLFSLEGEFEDDFRVPVEAEFDSLVDPLLVVDRRGRHHILTVRLQGDEPPWAPRLFWMILDGRGEVLDQQDYPSARRIGAFQPTTTLAAVSPDGNLVSGRNDRLRFITTAGDDIVRITTASAAGIRYLPEERAEGQAREEIFAKRQGRQPRDLPATKPIWSHFSIDGEGRLWVKRHVRGRRAGKAVHEDAGGNASRFFDLGELPGMEWGEDVVYDVIPSTGDFRWAVKIPESWTPASDIPRERVVFARGERVWTVRRGQFDEETVVQYRIRR